MAVIDDQATIAYSNRLNAAIKTSSNRKHTEPVKEDQIDGHTNIISWGLDNLEPQNIISDAKKNTIIPSTLSWKARVLYGAGLVYGFVDVDNEGNEILRPQQIPEVDEFLNRSKINRYISQASKAYYWFKINFPEFIISKDRTRITSIASQRPEYCRFENQDDKGNIKHVYINANWDIAGEGSSLYSTKVRMVDPYSNSIEQLKNSNSPAKFIYPVKDDSPGDSFYPEAEWNAIRLSGWLDVAKSIPKFKKAIFENQVTIKYLIEVSTWWWNWKYPGFDEYSTEEKKKVMNNELERFENFMTGTDSSGKSLMVTYSSNPDFQKEYAGWKITPIDNKLKDGIYIEDSQEASSHILYALDVDPTLRFAPGSNIGAGSGSDKRVAFNNHLIAAKPDQDKILEPLEFVRDFNGWDPRLKFWFRNYFQATLDKQKQPGESQQQAS